MSGKGGMVSLVISRIMVLTLFWASGVPGIKSPLEDFGHSIIPERHLNPTDL